MRILLAVHNAYTDSTSGAAQSMRILLQWLHEGGYECRALATARFDAKPPDNLDAHLADLDVPLRRSPPSKVFVRSVKKPANVVVGRPTVDFTLHGVPVTMLITRAKLGSVEDRLEAEQFLFLLDDVFHQFKPDVLLTYGGHSVVQEAMRRARRQGVLTVMALHNFGYEDRKYFEHVDEVFTCSPYLSGMYHQAIGLRSVALEPPIEWAEVEAPVEMRRFVTFVNPQPHKGSLLFARLADMLGSRRPDIPILVVQSAATGGQLNAIPGLDFKKYPHIMAAPPTPRPADFFALTKLLLVPSTCREAFGRVAAEALVNAIPPIVSDRGALPQTVRGAGRVIALPPDLTETTTVLPTVAQVEPWFEAVCELWDDASAYERAADLARQTAKRWYGEESTRAKHVEYFRRLETGKSPFD